MHNTIAKNPFVPPFNHFEGKSPQKPRDLSRGLCAELSAFWDMGSQKLATKWHDFNPMRKEMIENGPLL